MRPLSVRNPRVQRLTLLVKRSQERAEQRAFVVEGPTLLATALQSGATVREVYVDQDAAERSVISDLILGLPTSVDVFSLLPGVLDKIGDANTSQGLLAVVERPEPAWPVAADAPFVLVLDDVADPGNAGTLLRAAAAAGAGAVVCIGGVDPTNPKVVRASAGSVFTLPVLAAGSGPEAAVAAIGRLQAGGYRVLATSVRSGEPHDTADLSGAVAIVVGNEARGVSPDVAASSDGELTIAMAGPTESLNVAMAGTILCFEVLRRHRRG